MWLHATRRTVAALWLLARLSVSDVTFSVANGILSLSSSGFYEVTFLASNGGLLSLHDASNATLLSGPGCLWQTDQNVWLGSGRSAASAPLVSACDYSASNGTFSYSWNPSSLTLTFQYSSPASLSALVDIVAYEGAAHIDLSYTLTGVGAGVPALSRLVWPNGLAFDSSLASGAHVPFMPGLALTPAFFSRRGSYGFLYPDVGSWASLGHVAMKATPGHSKATTGWALFDLSGPDTILPHVWRLSPAQATGSDYVYTHEHPVNITAGCSPTNAAWPPCALGYNGTITRRLLIGSPDPFASTIAMAAHNGMVSPAWPSVAQAVASTRSPITGPAWPAQAYPTVLDKASAVGPDFALQWLSAPLMKLDARVVGLPYSEYGAKIYPRLPAPSIAHYAAYMLGGHDHNYPDFLPPDPVLNSSSCDMHDSVALANSLGLLTMPYLNPTWWSLTSQTLAPLSPAQLADVAALNATYQPSLECYGPNCGVATTPYSPFVQARIGEYMRQMSTNVTSGGQEWEASPCNESSVVMPFTFLFEDQLGARYPKIDYSPHARGMGPLAYAEGWREHVATYASVGLNTEQGVDKHARHIMGYWGSIISGLPGGPCGVLQDGDWLAFPLVSAVMRRHVTLNQHDLSGQDMAVSPAYAAWDIAHGYVLSLDVGTLPWGGVDQAWLDTVGAMQTQVMGRCGHMTQTGWVPAATWAAGVPMPTLGQPPAGLSLPPSVSWSRWSVDGLPALQPWYSDGYTALVQWDNTTAVQVQAQVYSNTSSPASFTVAPSGWLVYGDGGDAVAGLGQGVWNGAQLSPGTHAIVEDRTCSWLQSSGQRAAICVWHPSGLDTPLTLPVHPAWPAPVTNATATPVDRTGQPLGQAVPATVGNNGSTVTFTWARAISPTANATAYVLLPA